MFNCTICFEQDYESMRPSSDKMILEEDKIVQESRNLFEQIFEAVPHIYTYLWNPQIFHRQRYI
uniref:Uncharacterized protein n=1 Tax=Tetranychus urticae TaxID=32264 RepID=T1K038_TETUR